MMSSFVDDLIECVRDWTWSLAVGLVIMLGLVFIFHLWPPSAPSLNHYDSPSSSRALHGYTSAAFEYQQETRRNERGVVPAGSPAAELMVEATTPEVRSLQKEEAQRYGFTPRGCLAAKANAAEAYKLRRRPLEDQQ